MDAIVHLSVVDTLRFEDLVRHRGEALCRPRASLPNLETLSRQTLEARRCCPACIDRMARLRLKHKIDLPAAAGVVAGDLIRLLAQERESSKPRRRRGAMAFVSRD
jgi:hypothetical protein